MCWMIMRDIILPERTLNRTRNIFACDMCKHGLMSCIGSMISMLYFAMASSGYLLMCKRKDTHEHIVIDNLGDMTLEQVILGVKTGMEYNDSRFMKNHMYGNNIGIFTGDGSIMAINIMNNGRNLIGRHNIHMAPDVKLGPSDATVSTLYKRLRNGNEIYNDHQRKALEILYKEYK